MARLRGERMYPLRGKEIPQNVDKQSGAAGNPIGKRGK